MINKVLTNLVYQFYHKNICVFTEKDKYFKTEEYKRLKEILADFDSHESKILRSGIIDKFQNDYTLKNFTDASLFEWEDRCFTFNLFIIENEDLYTISLHLSVLVPYYVIRCQKGIIELWFSESQVSELQQENKESRTINDLILDIERIIEREYLYQKFPIELINTIIPDVSFQDSYLGHFTMYNAFFNNVIFKENEN